MLFDRTSPLTPASVACHRGRRGTILLEVILALGIFFTVATVVFAAMSSSFSTVQRVVVKARAADLAITKLSEIRLGEIEIADDGPNAYEEEDLTDWTWQIVATPVQSDTTLPAPETQVEVVITHAPSGQVYRVVRLFAPETGGRYREPEEMDLLGEEL